MPQNSPYILEICVETPDALAVCRAGVDRIELCGGLDVGGLTPDIGLMESAATSGIETHVLIRPRSGDFEMTPADLAVAVSSIRAARDVGLHGVVIGAERNGALDQSALDSMVRAADGLDVTLHRVIDVLDDPKAAMEVVIGYGAKRILSSGGAKTAAEGIAGLKNLHAAAAGRIEIMAGAGINSKNIGIILEQTKITSFHTSCSTSTPLDPRYARLGFGETVRRFDSAEFGRLVKMLNS